MYGTEISRISGSYNTAYIITRELISQSQANNNSTIKLRGYFYYGGGTHVTSAASSFVLSGTTIKTGSYDYYPGYTLLGQKDITVQHDNNGVFPTNYNISSSASSFHINGSTTGQITGIPNIPRNSILGAIEPFNIGSNIPIPITIYNEDYHHNLYFTYADEDYVLHTITREDIEISSGAYILELISSEWNNILNNLPNTIIKEFEFSLATFDEEDEQVGVVSLKYVNGTIVEDVTSKPTFTSFEYEDINPTTIALTNNPQKLILGYSDLKYKISVINKMIAKKGALGDYYIFHDGQSEDYIDNAIVEHLIERIDKNNLSVQAVDSRGFKSPLTSSTALIVSGYTAPKIIEAETVRENGVDVITRLKLEASLWNGNFGVDDNDVQYFGYRVKLSSSSTWSEWFDITTELSSIINTKSQTINAILIDENDDLFIHADGTSGGFTTGTAYDIELKISDGISTQIFNTSPNFPLEVQDGKVIRSVYKDETGEYRIGYNAMPDEDFNHNFGGTACFESIKNNGQVLFHAYIGTAVSLATGTVIPFNTEKFDVSPNGNCYYNSTYKFGAPISGYYQFNVKIPVQSPTDQQRYGFIIRVNTTNHNMAYRVQASGTGTLYVACSTLIKLNAGDLVDVITDYDATKTTGINDLPYTSEFSGFLVNIK